ncbi:hypothetical protein BCR44DRAFT_138271 [Catenaria anguillulae PL171]|uniref:Uncharacterized protein n=1 Tax=Catenaria anguillulae PL171 TaxID=765915 RepID=A0A1Y2I2V3_9FUNG|nr:hypothetical protein BCR44DRAFT_138271 [Catenaria anguillulae PL171]
MLDRFSPRLTSMDHTQRFAFVMDYAKLMKRHEDMTTKALVNNNMSTLDVDTRKIEDVTDDGLLTMMWNLYFFIRTMIRDLILPMSTRQHLIRIIVSGEDADIKLKSVRNAIQDIPKEQALNYKAIIGHSFRILHACNSETLASPLALIIGSLLFHEKVVPPKPKSFLDAIRKGTFKAISVDSLSDSQSLDNIAATPGARRDSLGRLSQEAGKTDSQPYLKTLNPEDADEGSIFSATVGTDEVVEMMAEDEVATLRAQMAKVLGSILRGEPAVLPEPARVMQYLADNFEALY